MDDLSSEGSFIIRRVDDDGNVKVFPTDSSYGGSHMQRMDDLSSEGSFVRRVNDNEQVKVFESSYGGSHM